MTGDPTGGGRGAGAPVLDPAVMRRHPLRGTPSLWWSAGVSAATVLLLCLAIVALRPPGAAAGPRSIADRYAAPGPDSVVIHEAVTDASGAVAYEVFAPKDLGPAGTRHAVITWGNGSYAHPSDYAALLHHLATWGFVVVAAETDQSGTGDEILAATRAVLARDTNPRSRFAGHLATTHVGAGGHSQGAGGTVRAVAHSGRLISAVLLADLPNTLFTFPPDTKQFSPSVLAVPAFFVAGEYDVIISNRPTNRAFYDSMRGPAAMALQRGADHNTVQHDGAGYRGDVTAWFRYLLDRRPHRRPGLHRPPPPAPRRPSVGRAGR